MNWHATTDSKKTRVKIGVKLSYPYTFFYFGTLILIELLSNLERIIFLPNNSTHKIWKAKLQNHDQILVNLAN